MHLQKLGIGLDGDTGTQIAPGNNNATRIILDDWFLNDSIAHVSNHVLRELKHKARILVKGKSFP